MPTSDDPRTLAGDLGGAVVRFSRRLRRERPEYADLSLSHLSALGSLERAGTLSPGELAAVERVQPPSMSRIVAHLVESGLVVRSAHPSDGRQAVLEVTNAGQALVAANRHAREAWLAQQVEGLSSAQRDTLREAAALLDRLAGS
jgi:DNA-binding MarR family transcriptional regulator